jgi:hypothetical protein
MTSPAEQPASDPRRVRPYAMTGGRTRPTHHALEIETLVFTTSVGEPTPKLTVEQRAIATLCHDLLSIAEVSAQLHLPLASSASWSGDMADEHLVMVYRPPTPATIPTWPCQSECCTGSTPSDEDSGLAE